MIDITKFVCGCRKDFTEYADVCFREFGDRISYWTTVNEPNVMATAGYDQGFAPPSSCSSPFGITNCSKGNSSSEPYMALHNMLFAHAAVFRLYKKEYQVQSHLFHRTYLQEEQQLNFATAY